MSAKKKASSSRQTASQPGKKAHERRAPSKQPSPVPVAAGKRGKKTEDTAQTATRLRPYLSRTAKEKDIPVAVSKPEVSVQENLHVPLTATEQPKSEQEHADLGPQDAQSPTSSEPDQYPTECFVCLDRKSKEEVVQYEDLPQWHSDCFGVDMICYTCYKSWLNRSVEDHPDGQIFCMHCEEEWDSEHMLQWIEPEVAARRERKMTSQFLEGEENFRWCANDRCQAGHFFDLEQTKNDPKICCGTCTATTCFECRVLWHEGKTCEEFKAASEAKGRSHLAMGLSSQSLKLIRQFETRRCPCCRTAIELTEGCDHVYCTSCGENFEFSMATKV